MSSQIEILEDADRLAEAAAGHILQAAFGAAQARGAFAIALSGGSTPGATYARLAQLAEGQGLDWRKVHVFWGDERCVPPDHPQSNYRQARQALLEHVPIPPGNIHRMPGELEPEAAARAYERELGAAFFGDTQAPAHARRPDPIDSPTHPPRFDLILLGLGRDGHIASLFPGSPALAERRRWVVARPPGDDGPWRLTLTPPVFNAAAKVVFLVSGREKAEILRRVLRGPSDDRGLPAQAVRPADGEVVWLLDAAAASLL